MPPYRKYRTVHKFGKRRRKRVKRLADAFVSPTVITSGNGALSESGSVDETTAGTTTSGGIVMPTGGSLGPDSQDQRRRIDTTFLSNDDRDQLQQKADEKIAALSSLSATERELRTLATMRNDTAPSTSAATYTVVNIDLVNELLCSRAKCNECGGTLSISRGCERLRHRGAIEPGM